MSLTESPPAFSSRENAGSRFSDQDTSISGDLFSLPGGAVKLAIGASYRTEDYRDLFDSSTVSLFNHVSRYVTAGYGEVQLPVFSAVNEVPAFTKLTLSAAGRFDRYSDFGDTRNPKFGVSWYPINSLELRGAYSTSFRAPATGTELVNSQRGTTGVLAEPFQALSQLCKCLWSL